MSLREEHRALTAGKIVDAVLELVAEGSLDELSVPAVAKRSGVSVATIYRYYRTKDELLAAAAAEPARRALANQTGDGQPDDELFAFQSAMWPEFAQNLPLLRHQVSSEAGRDMRTARLDESRRRLANYLAHRDVDAEEPEGRRLVSLLLLVTGSLALVELHDRQGLTVEEALAVSQWAVRELIDATVSEGVSA